MSARVDNERISILNSKFRGCSTTSVYGNGGAVEYFGSREMLISGSNFTDCHSQVNAGAISVNDGNVNTTLQHNTFEGCSAQINGGAIYVFLNNINTTISHSVFTNCGAKQSAGAIGFCNGNRDTTVVNVSIDNCYTGLGGGLGVDTHLGEFLLSESIFSGCISQYGGGLSVTQSDRITVLDTTIHDCMSFNSGGGMYLSKVDGVQISGSAVVNCFAQFSGGGAIFAAAVPVFVVNDTLINNCQAFGENGGGIKLHESVVTIAHSMVQNCSAAQGGGLYFVNANDSLIQDSAFLYNTASDVGGGIYLSYMDDLTFLNTSVVSNRAVTGAGVYVGPKNVRIAFGGLVARNNFALQYGGGVYFGSNVPNLIVTDTKTATNTVTLQTDHPYAYNVQNSPSTTLLYQQFEVSGGAIGFAISFDPRCSIRDGDSLQIYAGQVLDTSEVFSATAGTAYPGVDSPSLMLFDTLVIVEFTGYYDYSPYAYGYYGLKMYVTPIYSRVDYPSLMDSNRALYGGGMYMYQRLLAPFFLNAKFANNVATNGGGMYMYSDITYLTMYGVAFLANEATKNGGGVYMNKDILQVSISNLYLAENTAMGSGGGMFIYSDVGGNISDSSFVANTASFGGGLTLQTTQVSLDLNRIEFSHNHAVSGSGGGGAVAFLSNNGDFSSEQVYRIALQGCVYSNNTAISGGAVYANADNVITFVSSTFSLNSATNGAGMYLNSQNSFLLHNITFNGNVAEKGGGGIMSLDSNNIGISSSTLQANQATAGGGMFVSGGTTVAFESTTLHSNVASEVGGAMASVSSPMFTVAEGGVLSLSGNSAHRGSALFFQSLLSGGAIANTEFIGNMAQVGGTVYWLYDPTMNQEPVGLDSVSNSWAGNTAPYGVRSATQALQLHGPQQYTLTAYLQALTPPIVLTLTDYYNQPIPLTDSTSVVPSIHTTDEHLCEPGHPTISGNDILGVIFDQGNATFGKMQAFCYPGGSVTLYFTAQLGDQIDSIPTSVSQSYYLKTSTHVSFRPCVMGEIIRNDACVPCPAWSYSLASTVNADTNCVSCGSTDGIAICQANKITLTGGYWRR